MPQSERTKPRKLPQQERSKETVEAILIATTHILVESGHESTNTNKIAERAGVSIGSLYQYFPSKEAIIAALIERHADSMTCMIEAKLLDKQEAPLEVALRELVKVCISAHTVNPKLHQVLIKQVPRVGQLEKLNDVEKRVQALIRSYLETQRNQIQPQNLDLAAFMLAHSLESLIHAAAAEPSLAVNEEFEQELTAILLCYLTCGL
ncbi:transcriptional regulator [Calothrix sp. NIES-4071]|nr:transcriptional regulator [Calothrix sp. NIES-4071]BAZ60864.1 transcriptional regulator [Calothrix sp. NIES-4105]